MTPAHVLQRPAALLSGDRKLCRWAARIVARVDRRDELALLPLDHDGAGTLLDSIPEGRRTDHWWLVLRDGTPVRGDRSGALMLLVALWLGRPVGRVPRSLRVSSFLDSLEEAAGTVSRAPRRSVQDDAATADPEVDRRIGGDFR